MVSRVAAFGGNSAGGIINTGAISAKQDGIFVVDIVTTFSGGVTNAGVIGADQGGVFFELDAVVSGDIVNTGVVVVAGIGGGIGLGAISTFFGSINNSGTISANSKAIFVANTPTFVGVIANGGTIAAKQTGIFIGRSTIFGAIVDCGTIKATSHGILIDGGEISRARPRSTSPGRPSPAASPTPAWSRARPAS